MARRFLLDQNFPPPPVTPSEIDATVDYVPLIDFDSRLAEKQTPDWLIILTAAASGDFDGMVTRDAAQLDQAEEMLAVMRTELAIVTWRKQIDDPVEIWGHLIAYMSHIQRRMDQDGPRLFVLPAPNLQRSNVRKASGELGRLASEQQRSTAQVRHEAVTYMRDELRRRDMSELLYLLDI